VTISLTLDSLTSDDLVFRYSQIGSLDTHLCIDARAGVRLLFRGSDVHRTSLYVRLFDLKIEPNNSPNKYVRIP
jgi:hypothetical protein